MGVWNVDKNATTHPMAIEREGCWDTAEGYPSPQYHIAAGES